MESSIDENSTGIALKATWRRCLPVSSSSSSVLPLPLSIAGSLTDCGVVLVVTVAAAVVYVATVTAALSTSPKFAFKWSERRNAQLAAATLPLLRLLCELEVPVDAHDEVVEYSIAATNGIAAANRAAPVPPWPPRKGI